MTKLMIRVKCPRCENERNTTTLKTVKCFHCGRSFKVYPARGKSRIVRIVDGGIKLLHERYLHEFGHEKRR